MAQTTIEATIARGTAQGFARGSGRGIKPKISRDDWIMRAAMLLIAAFLVVALVLPLYTMLSKSVQDKAGAFIGLTNYAQYFGTPALFASIYNSLFIAVISTVITISLAFFYAYALTRSCMPGRSLCRRIAPIPRLAPYPLPGISLTSLFGTPGLFSEIWFGPSHTGPISTV